MRISDWSSDVCSSDINSAGGVGSMSIRGQNSISAGNTPLIVLDGVIYHGSLADIAPDDVKSLTALKDASAAAIYGSRSANGVILIEKKAGKGINGKPQFNVEKNGRETGREKVW